MAGAWYCATSGPCLIMTFASNGPNGGGISESRHLHTRHVVSVLLERLQTASNGVMPQLVQVAYDVSCSDVYDYDVGCRCAPSRPAELRERAIIPVTDRPQGAVMAASITNFMATAMEQVIRQAGWCSPCTKDTGLNVVATSSYVSGPISGPERMVRISRLAIVMAS